MLAILGAAAPAATAAQYPAGFREETLPFTGLEQPVAVAFGPDGSVYVAEEPGIVKRFASPTASGPGQVVIDLRSRVNSYGDHGLLGLAVDPDPAKRRLFVLYTTEDALPGTRTYPAATGGSWNDDCPEEVGGTKSGCVTAGRLSRVAMDASFKGTEQPLIHDWCSQFDTHSVGALAFGADGQLYASGGEGANPVTADWGQFGGGGGLNPARNPCGDPVPVTDDEATRPSAEGGALRAQDVLTPTDPTTLDGAIIRVDPDTGAASAGNPLSGDANRRRIIAYGLRNPFRFALRPGTDELWLGDVGSSTHEEIDRIADVDDAVAENFGWPCYEGPATSYSWGFQTNALCRRLLATPGAATAPRFSYEHGQPVVAGDGCAVTDGSATSGLRFYPATGGTYPARYRGGLFLADYGRSCVWFAPKGSDGQPDFTRLEGFGGDAGYPVDLQIGPDGDLYVLDILGAVKRIRYVPGNQPPVARITKQSPAGPASSARPPLTVDFDGSTTTDADDTVLTYAWDLDGDGAFDDSTLADPPASTYTQAGAFTVRLRVRDPLGAESIASSVVRTTNSGPPVPRITLEGGDPYAIGDAIAASGAAIDAEDGEEPASRLSWTVQLRHCVAEGGCHTHPLRTVAGAARLTLAAAEHPWPSYHVITLTASDAGGLSASTSVEVHPKRSDLALAATVGGAPVPGLALLLGETTLPGSASSTPLSTGASTTLSAAPRQNVGADTYVFRRWSDGVTASGRSLTIAPGTTTLSALFDQVPRALVAPALSGEARAGSTLAATLGTWAASPAPTRTRQWERCGAAAGSPCATIDGATGATYVPTAADVGATVRVRVRADNGTGAVVEALSDRSAPVGDTTAPAIAFDAPAPAGFAVGDVVAFTAVATDAEDGPVPATQLSWTVTAIRPGAPDELLATLPGRAGGTVVAPDRPWPTLLRVAVTALDTRGQRATATQDVVPRRADVVLGATVAGVPVAGLDASLDGTPAAGAALPRTVGSTVRVAADPVPTVGADRYRLAGWSDGPAAAERSLVVPPGGLALIARYDQAPRALMPPVVRGTARVGARLGVDRGTWSGSPAPVVASAWERCTPAGGCAPIAGATATAYVLTAADVGSTIRVRESADNGVLGPVAAASAATLPVLATEAPAPAPTATSGAPAGSSAPGVLATAPTTTGLSPALQPSPAPPAGTPAPAGSAAASSTTAAPVVGLSGAARQRASGPVRVTLRCGASSPGPCAVTLRTTVRLPGGRAVVLRRLSRVVRPFHPVRVEVALPPRTRAKARAAVASASRKVTVHLRAEAASAVQAGDAVGELVVTLRR